MNNIDEKYHNVFCDLLKIINVKTILKLPNINPNKEIKKQNEEMIYNSLHFTTKDEIMEANFFRNKENIEILKRIKIIYDDLKHLVKRNVDKFYQEIEDCFNNKDLTSDMLIDIFQKNSITRNDIEFKINYITYYYANKIEISLKLFNNNRNIITIKNKDLSIPLDNIVMIYKSFFDSSNFPYKYERKIDESRG